VCQELRIADPVELKLVRYTNKWGTVGRVVGFRDGAWRIAIDTTLHPDDAAETLLHELAHVLQAQRLGGIEALFAQADRELLAGRLVGPGARRFFRHRAALRMPLEREAEQLAREWYFEYLIVEPKPAPSRRGGSGRMRQTSRRGS